MKIGMLLGTETLKKLMHEQLKGNVLVDLYVYNIELFAKENIEIIYIYEDMVKDIDAEILARDSRQSGIRMIYFVRSERIERMSEFIENGLYDILTGEFNKKEIKEIISYPKAYKDIEHLETITVERKKGKKKKEKEITQKSIEIKTSKKSPFLDIFRKRKSDGIKHNEDNSNHIENKSIEHKEYAFEEFTSGNDLKAKESDKVERKAENSEEERLNNLLGKMHASKRTTIDISKTIKTKAEKEEEYWNNNSEVLSKFEEEAEEEAKQRVEEKDNTKTKEETKPKVLEEDQKQVKEDVKQKAVEEANRMINEKRIRDKAAAEAKLMSDEREKCKAEKKENRSKKNSKLINYAFKKMTVSDTGEKKYKNQKEVEYKIAGQKTIAIMGTNNAVGTTHTALMICSTFSKSSKVAYVDFSNNNKLKYFKLQYEIDEKKKKFKLNGINFYQDKSIYDKIKNYDIVVFDLGNYKNNANFMSFKMAQYKVVVADANLYNKKIMFDFCKTYKETYKDYTYILKTASKKEINAYKEYIDSKNVYTLDYEKDYFKPSKQTKDNINQIIRS